MGQVLEAKESFTTELDGNKIHVVAGRTRVDEEHALALRFPQHFKPTEANFGVEAATDNPGEVRARVAAEAAGTASADSTASDGTASVADEGSGSSEGESSGSPAEADAGKSGTAPATASRPRKSTPSK